jgi:hypothetical protein
MSTGKIEYVEIIEIAIFFTFNMLYGTLGAAMRRKIDAALVLPTPSPDSPLLLPLS